MSKRVELNGRNYVIEVNVARDVGGAELQVLGSYTLNKESTLYKIKLSNDLLEPFPVVELFFKDMGNLNESNFRADGMTFIEVSITDESRQDKVAIYHEFVADTINVVNHEQTVADVHIIGKSLNFAKMLSYVSHSTGHTPEQATKLLYTVLHKVGLKLKPNTYETTNSILYMTPVNRRLYDVMMELQELSTSDQGLFNYIYNMHEGVGEIVSLNHRFSDITAPGKYVSEDNVFMLPAYDEVSNYTTIIKNEPMYTNPLNGTTMVKHGGNITVEQHKYNTREISHEEMTTKQFAEALPKINAKEGGELTYSTDVSEHISENNLKYDTNYPGRCQHVFHKRLYNLFIYGDNLAIDVQGGLKREVGDMIMVNTSPDMYDQDVSRYKRVGGYWMIGRVTHTFTNDSHETGLIAIRTNNGEKK